MVALWGIVGGELSGADGTFVISDLSQRQPSHVTLATWYISSAKSGEVGKMTSIEQLEALRRQVEEDFKLDIAAIDRLQRRFKDMNASVSRVSLAPVEKQSIEANGTGLPPALESRGQQPDELTESLRTMFSSYRK